ncbi:MAG TPA: HIT domain-containing protein [Rickettsiales bacterium]|nr:HIT domain-containing protein [Rickettsiales bacterium]
MFKLDEVLKNDTFFVCDLYFSRLLLMNNANYPWLILVPKLPNLVEFTDLEFNQQLFVLKEINFIAKFLQDKFRPYKLNIAMLGNVVRQLHIHIIVRFENDKVFPRPVFGEAITKYDDLSVQRFINEIREICQEKIW